VVGECNGKIRSMPTPKLTRRTVKVALDARPFLEITTPSNAWRRSFTFSPSPSCRRTLTRTVSPGRNSGRSLRNCASWSLRITGFMFLFRARAGGASSLEKIENYRQMVAIFLVDSHWPPISIGLNALRGPSQEDRHDILPATSRFPPHGYA